MDLFKAPILIGDNLNPLISFDNIDLGVNCPALKARSFHASLNLQKIRLREILDSFLQANDLF
jgi:hypothetical protein